MAIDLGSRLHILRKKHGYSLEKVAAAVGVEKELVEEWEDDEATPNTAQLVALADLYHITMDQLVRGKDVVDGEVVEGKTTKPIRLDAPQHPVILSCLGLIALVAYLLCGFLWHTPDGQPIGWASMWILLLSPILIRSIYRAIVTRRLIEFNMVILVVMVYVGMGIIGNFYQMNFWHPYWVEFFAIPIFYTLAGAVVANQIRK